MDNTIDFYRQCVKKILCEYEYLKDMVISLNNEHLFHLFLAGKSRNLRLFVVVLEKDLLTFLSLFPGFLVLLNLMTVCLFDF